MLEIINTYLTEMQGESPNCGGHYHFTKFILPEGDDLSERMKKYLLTIPAYQNPFVEVNSVLIPVQDRQVENLKLELIPDFESSLSELLQYWRTHRTSLDCREEVTEQYFIKEAMFKNTIVDFLESLNELRAYKMKGIDTYFAHEIGGDMVGDDIIFESSSGSFALHFGWSS